MLSLQLQGLSRRPVQLDDLHVTQHLPALEHLDRIRELACRDPVRELPSALVLRELAHLYSRARAPVCTTTHSRKFARHWQMRPRVGGHGPSLSPRASAFGFALRLARSSKSS